jgi:hypothetical protein
MVTMLSLLPEKERDLFAIRGKGRPRVAVVGEIPVLERRQFSRVRPIGRRRPDLPSTFEDQGAPVRRDIGVPAMPNELSRASPKGRDRPDSVTVYRVNDSLTVGRQRGRATDRSWNVS